MALVLEERDSSLKRRCQALGNLRDEAQDARHIGCSKTRLPGVCSTPLQEKLVAPILFQGIYHQGLLTKDLMKKKFYSIASTDLGSKTLVIFGIRIMAKFGGMTYQVEPEDRSRSKKARPERHDLTGQLRKINSRRNSLNIRQLLVLLPIYPYVSRLCRVIPILFNILLLM